MSGVRVRGKTSVCSINHERHHSGCGGYKDMERYRKYLEYSIKHPEIMPNEGECMLSECKILRSIIRGIWMIKEENINEVKIKKASLSIRNSVFVSLVK